MKKKLLKILGIEMIMLFVFSGYSFAYIDPSAMTYLVQIISVVIVSITTFFGVTMYKINKKLKNGKKKEKVVKMNLDEYIGEKEEQSKETDDKKETLK